MISLWKILILTWSCSIVSGAAAVSSDLSSFLSLLWSINANWWSILVILSQGAFDEGEKMHNFFEDGYKKGIEKQLVEVVPRFSWADNLSGTYLLLKKPFWQTEILSIFFWETTISGKGVSYTDEKIRMEQHLHYPTESISYLSLPLLSCNSKRNETRLEWKKGWKNGIRACLLFFPDIFQVFLSKRLIGWLTIIKYLI